MWWCGSVHLQASQIFAKRVIKLWNRLHREVVNASSLSVFKRHLDNTLNNMI